MCEDSKWVGTEVLQVDQLESVKSQRNVRNVSVAHEGSANRRIRRRTNVAREYEVWSHDVVGDDVERMKTKGRSGIRVL